MISLPLRLGSVMGYDGRANNIIYCCPITLTQEPSIVVFFGGDIQDFSENMESHRDHKTYIKWNLENTAQIISSKFPHSHVFVIRPVRMEYKTFSCFNNFVPCNETGAPEYVPMYFGLKHLQQLLQNSFVKLQQEVLSSENTSLVKAGQSQCQQSNTSLDLCKVILIGFSKGTVVLNQFLHEFYYAMSNSSSLEFISKIKDMYWLDGGHSGGKNTWITSRPLLKNLTNLGISVQIHVTPYQIADDRRPWIRKEEKLFRDFLKDYGANIQRKIYFESDIPNLDNHFELLNVFSAKSVE